MAEPEAKRARAAIPVDLKRLFVQNHPMRNVPGETHAE
jgi:hypothetical protein